MSYCRTTTATADHNAHHHHAFVIIYFLSFIYQMHTDSEVRDREEQTKQCITLNALPATALYRTGKLSAFYSPSVYSVASVSSESIYDGLSPKTKGTEL